MYRLALIVFMVASSSTNVFSQCSCSSSCITSQGDGDWNGCLTFFFSTYCGAIGALWSTATIHEVYNHTIDDYDHVTVTFATSDYHARTKNIIIREHGELTIQHDFTTSRTSNCNYICVADDALLTVSAGSGKTVDFENAELHVYSKVKITSGTLKVKKVFVYSGGSIEIEDGKLIKTSSASNALTIEDGGSITITGSGSIGYSGFGNHYAVIDGTLDLGANYNYVSTDLGTVKVTYGESTGLLRLSTGNFPGVDNSEYSTLFNNFFGGNQDYGGTVEYYGGTSVSQSGFGRSQYYSLKISCPTFKLNKDVQIGGLLVLDGDLDLNGEKLKISGSISYSSSNKTLTSSSSLSELWLLGKFSFGLSQSYLTTDSIIGYSTGNSNILKPEIRIESTIGSTAILSKLYIYRNDVVVLSDPLKIYNCLELKLGILKTTSSTSPILQVGAISKKRPGRIKGSLTQTINQSGVHHFPIGTRDSSKVDAIFYGVSNSSEFEISETALPHPSSAILSGALNRYWSISTSLVFDSCYFTIRYNRNDFPNGTSETANESSLIFGKYAGGVWSYPTIISWDTVGRGGTVTLKMTGFSDIGIGTSQGVLDIDFLDVRVDCDEINWTVADEVNLSHYLVMGSYDGSNFFILDTLKNIVTGNTFTTSHSIENIYVHYGIKFIKLLAEETDGVLSHSDIVELDCPSEILEFDIYPNPGHSILNIELPEEGLLEFWSADGRLIKREFMRKGKNDLVIEKLPLGVYFVIVNGNAKTFVKNEH